jgi:ubiquinone/menaquinone biosynthesis C-methylase UbiE
MFLHPADTIKQLFIREDWHIADIGAGSGEYTLAVAKLVPEGRVYAVDVRREILPFIQAKMKTFGCSNVEVLWGDVAREEGTNLSDGSMDAVIVANVFFQFEDKEMAVREIKRILKPGGVVLFVDWVGSFGNTGPREEDIISPTEALVFFEKHGFVKKEDVPSGEYHYGMIFVLS